VYIWDGAVGCDIVEEARMGVVEAGDGRSKLVEKDNG
jgi:hypothetical protein